MQVCGGLLHFVDQSLQQGVGVRLVVVCELGVVGCGVFHGGKVVRRGCALDGSGGLPAEDVLVDLCGGCGLAVIEEAAVVPLCGGEGGGAGWKESGSATAVVDAGWTECGERSTRGSSRSSSSCL